MAQPPIIKYVHNSKSFVRYYINTLIFEIQNVSKHALVHPVVFHLCFVGDAPASYVCALSILPLAYVRGMSILNIAYTFRKLGFSPFLKLQTLFFLFHINLQPVTMSYP
jgi:hypothetical protein